MLEIHYVFQWPVRICHWVNVVCIIVLSFTGFYIGHPFITASDSAAYVMGWNRFIHFLFAYIFCISVLVRIIWCFVGNHHASWRAFFPYFTAKGRKGLFQMLRYYTFTGKKITYDVGHNPMAATVYSVVFLLYLVQIGSGFALYGQFSPGGFWNGIFGPLLGLFGNQGLRLTHHLVMWLLIGFAINHFYSAWLMDVKERNGTVSGIFGGYQFIEPEDL